MPNQESKVKQEEQSERKWKKLPKEALTKAILNSSEETQKEIAEKAKSFL